MTGAAPRVEQQRVVGEAQVLQVFEMPDKRQDMRTAVAGCRVSDGSIRAGTTYKVLRGGEVVRIPCSQSLTLRDVLKHPCHLLMAAERLGLSNHSIDLAKLHG